MKVARIAGKEQVELVDRPEPKPWREFAVVRVEVAPMCTEYKGFKEGWVNDSLGHEAAGTVVATDGNRGVEVGQRVLVLPQYPCGRCPLCLRGEYVYCQHSVDALAVTGNPYGTATYAQFLIKQDWMLVPIPDDLSTEHASMANCALGPAFGGLRLTDVDALDTVLVTGLGPVGLGAIILLKRMGARVIATESFPYRRQLAAELGADVVLDSNDPDVLAHILSLTNGVGVDRVIECSGAPAAQRLGIDAIRRLGSYVFVGEAKELTVHVSDDFIRKGLKVIGSWYYNIADVPPLFQIIRETLPLLDRLITHRFGMSQVEEAFRLQAAGGCGKVLLDPWS